MGGPRVLIVGAGAAGVCMAAMLQRDGIHDFEVLEQGPGIGGVWRENRYPGVGCDVPSHHYQFSFATRSQWSSMRGAGHEIRDYLETLVRRDCVGDRFRFGVEVTAMRYRDQGWDVEASDGVVRRADFVVSAVGALHHPKLPDLPGLDAFAGEVFHSARWPDDFVATGRRVGVLGAGSTASQLVPGLVELGAEVVALQRTPQWIFPLPNPRITPLGHALHRLFPGLSGLKYRAWRWFYDRVVAPGILRPGPMRRLLVLACRLNLRTVRDRELRRKLTPRDQPLCKRVVMTTGFYRALQRPNATLEIDRIDRVLPHGVRLADGREVPLDALVLATGFEADAFLSHIAVTGPGGRSLKDTWSVRPRTYRTVMIPGFPNLFTLDGPFSPVGTASVFGIIEAQAGWATRWIGRARDGVLGAVDVTDDATDRHLAELERDWPDTAWMTGCNSWYIGDDGWPLLGPWSGAQHRALLATDPPVGELVLEPPAAGRNPAAVNARAR